MSRPEPFLAAFFMAFRLTYAYVIGFYLTQHGTPWLVTGLIVLFSFGSEWGRRRVNARSASGQLLDNPARRQRATGLVILALVFLGFTPEEGLVGIILWTAIGLAWADILPDPPMLPERGWAELTGWLAGMTVGLLGMAGPSPWIAALLIGIMLWKK